MMFEVTIIGAPRTKGNSPQLFGRRGKIGYVPSKSFRQWEAIAVPQLRIAMRGAAAFSGRVQVSAVFFRARAIGDLDNYMKAMGDILQTAKVIANDRLIVSWDGTRLESDSKRPRVELRVQAL